MNSRFLQNIEHSYDIWHDISRYRKFIHVVQYLICKHKFFLASQFLASIILFLLCVSFPSAQVKLICLSLHALADVSLNYQHVAS